MSDEIKMISSIVKMDGDYVAICPHCSGWATFSEGEMEEIRGEMFQHPRCGNWFEVSGSAKYEGRRV